MNDNQLILLTQLIFYKDILKKHIYKQKHIVLRVDSIIHYTPYVITPP